MTRCRWVWFLLAALLLLPGLALAQGPRGLTLQDAQSTGNGTALEVTGYSLVGLTIIGSSGADRVVNWEATQDGTNYVAISCQNRNSLAIATTATATSTTAQLWSCPVPGMQKFRARLSGGASGTVTVTGTALPMVSQILRSGDSVSLPGSYTQGDLLYADTAASLAKLADVAAGSYVRSGGVGAAPVWSTTTLPNSATAGDLLYASASNVYANLADVAAGAYLRSGGTTTAPVWSSVTLPNSATTGDLLYASATNVYANRAAVAVGQVLASNGTGTAPVWSKAPQLTAGGGTQTYTLGGTLYWEFTNTANAADNLYVGTTAYSLPAGTMATAGDQLVIDWDLKSDATAATRSYECNIGYSDWDSTAGFTGGFSFVNTTFTTVSAGLHSRAMITRTTSGQAAYHSEAIVGTASASSWQQRLWNTASITWANAQNIKCHAKSSVATAGLVTLEELRVSWVPR